MKFIFDEDVFKRLKISFFKWLSCKEYLGFDRCRNIHGNRFKKPEVDFTKYYVHTLNTVYAISLGYTSHKKMITSIPFLP